MKMKWWGWIGIGLIVYAAEKLYRNPPFPLNGSEVIREGVGLAAIALTLNKFPYIMAYIVAGVLIWLSARQKSN